MRRRVPIAAAVCAVALLSSAELRPRADQGPTVGPATPIVLRPTAHDPVPADPAGYWVSPAAPGAISPALRDFARAVTIIEDGGDSQSVAPLLAPPLLDKGPLTDYVRYYRGVVALRAGRLDEAAAILTTVAASTPSAVQTQAAVRLAEAHEQQGHYADAAAAYGRALAGKVAEPDHIAHQWGVALERAGDPAGAIAAHRRVYYDFPLSADAAASGDVLARLDALDTPFEGQLAKEQARADALYAARRWALARTAYERVSDLTADADRAQAQVRIAAADVQLKQYRMALDRLRPLLADGPQRAEAALQVALATRGQGQTEEFERQVRQLVSAFPTSPFAEEALNALATSYILRDDDETAAGVFANMLAAFPAGRFAERAAWKAGWWAYRHDAMTDAIRFFEAGAANFPRSDFRPAWLYWSARAKERAGDPDGATARYVLTATDYRNSYYGRLALGRLGDRQALVTRTLTERTAPVPAPPTQPVLALLLSLGLNDQVIAEAEFARRMWGDSPALLATTALAHHRAGRLRPGINAMKRAYPQYLAAGGESLPPEVLRVLFPLDYWRQLEMGAKRQGLDPYLVVALAAQESTFDAGIQSSAGAIGLMQIMPATGRALARQIGLKPFATRRLADPEVNMTLGTEYLGDLMTQFGQAAYALAGYNAGGHRVTKWLAERPGLPIDEWIDDIPFAETQNYVKRILGTAEDYRRLYGGGLLAPLSTSATSFSSAVPAKAKRATAIRPAPKAAPQPKRRAAPARPTAKRRTTG